MNHPIFTASDFYRGPDLTRDDVDAAEAVLGFTLPAAYVDLLFEQNGGSLGAGCFPTEFPTSWAPTHIQIDAIRGIGGEWGIESEGPRGSRSMIDEWDYPAIGVVICEMPSGGHDAVMLDYTTGADEPAVAYVDEDRIPRILARSVAEFIDALVPCEWFD